MNNGVDNYEDAWYVLKQFLIIGNTMCDMANIKKILEKMEEIELKIS